MSIKNTEQPVVIEAVQGRNEPKRDSEICERRYERNVS